LYQKLSEREAEEEGLENQGQTSSESEDEEVRKLRGKNEKLNKKLEEVLGSREEAVRRIENQFTTERKIRMQIGAVILTLSNKCQ
jgi:hypothetical protein